MRDPATNKHWCRADAVETGPPKAIFRTSTLSFAGLGYE